MNPFDFCAARRHRQRGVAAIEFALVFVGLFGLFYLVVTFGSTLYIQQAVARSAEDGARAANALHTAERPQMEENVRRVVHESLSRSWVVPPEHTQSEGERLDWIRQNVQVSVNLTDPLWGHVDVHYRSSSNPILPTLPLLPFDMLRLDQLRSQAVVALRH